MKGLTPLATAWAIVLMALAGPVLAQFKVEDPGVLAQRLNYLMPQPSDKAVQDATKRYVPPTPAEMRKRGLQEAPALAAEAGLACRVADARWIGDGAQRHNHAKSVFYEVACDGDLGFILIKTEGAPTRAETCLETTGPRPSGKTVDLSCALPENRDLMVGLVPYIARTGKDCPPERVRAVGHSEARTAFELACKGGAGFIMLTSAPPRLDKPIEIHPCLSYPVGATLACLYTDRKAQLAMVDHLAARAGIACAITDRAYIGESDRDGASFWEAACADGRGYVLKQGLDGGLARAVDCASAGLILAGGCHLTDTAKARRDQAAVYARQVQAAGFACQVTDYALRANRPDGAAAVELACADRPAGVIAFLPSTGAPTVIDCAHAGLLGYSCGLSKASAAYPALTADLRAVGKTTCVVSDARVVGVTPSHHAYAEVACADGLQGFMVEYQLSPDISPLAATVCAQAEGVGAGCALPENRRG